MVSFIITSLTAQLLLSSVYDRKIFDYTNSNVSIYLASKSGIMHNVYDAHNSDFIVHSGGVLSICVSATNIFVNQNASVHSPSNEACVLYDISSQQVELFADIAAVTPVWYSVTSCHYIVTTDLLAAVAMGFRYITPLGPGMHIAIDGISREIVHMNHWQDHHRSEGDYDVKDLFYAAERSLSSHDISTTELDVTDASSLLMECLVSSSTALRRRYKTRPLVVDTPQPEDMPREMYGEYCILFFALLTFPKELIVTLQTNEPQSIAWKPRCYLRVTTALLHLLMFIVCIA